MKGAARTDTVSSFERRTPALSSEISFLYLERPIHVDEAIDRDADEQVGPGTRSISARADRSRLTLSSIGTLLLVGVLFESQADFFTGFQPTLLAVVVPKNVLYSNLTVQIIRVLHVNLCLFPPGLDAPV